MPPSDLATIQRLQFSDRPAAEALTREWLEREFGIRAESVRLTPSAVSLNSFNGVYASGGERVFFKSHIEPGSTIREYYNAKVLQDAGYNTVMPLRVESEEGRQIAFYPVIDAPTIFDRVVASERGADPGAADEILAGQTTECARLLEIYAATAAESSAAEHAEAPIHQLFWHRLTQGRLDAFYGDASMMLGGREVSFAELRGMAWVINGVEQQRTLGELIAEASSALDPRRAATTSVGHGDAHFGNVFLEDGRFLYFDPAFAGRHDPLLDVVKPFFHNVFARWMYFPDDVAQRLQLVAAVEGGVVRLEYGPHLTRYRQRLHDVMRGGLVEPVLAGAESREPRARRMLHLALMCCPLLTMNLADRSRFAAPVGLLGLALALQMGNGDARQELRLSAAEALETP